MFYLGIITPVTSKWLPTVNIGRKEFFSLDHEDGKIEGQANLKNYITRFYKDLFGPSQDNTMILDESQTIDIPQVSQAENKFLTASFTEKKIQDAVFAMEHNKAPGQMASQLSFIKSFRMSSKWT